MRLYWDVVNGNKNRHKLRLRYYNENPAAPVLFEIKRRSDNAILKERGAVKRRCVVLCSPANSRCRTTSFPAIPSISAPCSISAA